MSSLLFPFGALIKYRGLIYATTQREIYSRYAGSLFGALWLILPPLCMIFIYTVVFSRIMQARLPGIDNQYAYSIYLCAGVIAWGALIEVLQKSKSVFLENANLIKKSNFPHWVLFIPVVLVAAFNSLVLLLIVGCFMLLFGYPITLSALHFIPVLALALLLGLAVGGFLSILNVFFRDTGQISDVVFQFLFWGTPIVYPINIIPEAWQGLLQMNPMLPVINLAHAALLGQPAHYAPLMYPAVIGLVTGALALFLYHRSRADILDQI